MPFNTFVNKPKKGILFRLCLMLVELGPLIKTTSVRYDCSLALFCVDGDKGGDLNCSYVDTTSTSHKYSGANINTATGLNWTVDELEKGNSILDRSLQCQHVHSHWMHSTCMNYESHRPHVVLHATLFIKDSRKDGILKRDGIDRALFGLSYYLLPHGH